MCGIVGGVTKRAIVPVLLSGLKQLEYRGYDSAGLATLMPQELKRVRALGKVANLERACQQTVVTGSTGIAHTRWATHGAPAEKNAHPHIYKDIAVVHNGIIENYLVLKAELAADGHVFTSDTDSEVIAHLIDREWQRGIDFSQACRRAVSLLQGAYALAVICSRAEETLFAARKGSPLCIGLGVEEHFIASDVQALLSLTSRFIFLQEGDTAVLTYDRIHILDEHEQPVTRKISLSQLSADTTDKGEYRHYMEKEIQDQATVISDTVRNRIINGHFAMSTLGQGADDLFQQIQAVHIIACGTSFHAAKVAHYWLEKYAQLPCHVEVASEYRYRDFVVPKNTLFIAISQSGETADTLAALRHARKKNYSGCLGICNVAESSLTRESDFVLLTRAGTEIGVASTKAFTTQLAALLLIVDGLCQHTKSTSADRLDLGELAQIDALVAATLSCAKQIQHLAELFQDKQHTLFLGRGELYPIAMEGALKLKEISYIHAEAYPAGELKHGPLALIDEDMPVVAIAPCGQLIEKLKSNLAEVKARGGKLIIFTDKVTEFKADDSVVIVKVAACPEILAPIIYTLPLQLLAYHVAVLRGTDVDQPRNLAKSVTVE